jgi:hypothetical protein
LDEKLKKLVVDKAEAMNNPRIPDLVDGLVNDGLKFEDASEAVYVLWKKGVLNLSEPKPYTTLSKYITSLESLWFWVLTALVGSTVYVAFMVDSFPLVYIRYILGGVFVLFLPGAVLMAALYPRGEDMDGLERLALSIGLSLAVVPLIGLVLNYTPWGIRLAPIMIALAFFAEALAFAAVSRKYRYYKLSLI